MADVKQTTQDKHNVDISSDHTSNANINENAESTEPQLKDTPQTLKTEESNETPVNVIKTRKLVRNSAQNKPKVEQLASNDNEDIIGLSVSEEKLFDDKSRTAVEVSQQSDTNRDIETEQQTIKGRKLMRSADRSKAEFEDYNCDDKKAEVLNKLANLNVSNNSQWNNWFGDIKSAAITATSTTVSHASKWSINPKSLLTKAVDITNQLGMCLQCKQFNINVNLISILQSKMLRPLWTRP